LIFSKKLSKKLNSASESEIKKVKNEIIKNDLTSFFEEVTLHYDSIEEFKNLVDVICLFPQNIKSIFFATSFGTKIKYGDIYGDIENCIDDINPKLKQFKKLENLYFTVKSELHGLLSQLDFTQYPELREIGQFSYDHYDRAWSRSCHYRSLLENTESWYPGYERLIFRKRKDIHCTEAFEALLKSITKQQHLKTLLNKGLLTIRIGDIYFCPLTPFRLFNLCDEYNISYSRIYGLEDEFKKSFRNLAARSIIIPAHIPTDIRSVSHYLTRLNG